MRSGFFGKVVLTTALLGAAGGVFAQYRDPGPVMQAQREAIDKLRFLDGTWRGPAWTLTPDGQRREVTQTERVGPFLGGAVKVVEGRGYAADGTVAFNAFGIISFDPEKKAYAMRSYAMGHATDFPVTVTPVGFGWERPAGPNAVVKYVATVKDGTWFESGDYVAQGQPPRRILEMTLKRVGDTTWPAADPVAPK